MPAAMPVVYSSYICLLESDICICHAGEINLKKVYFVGCVSERVDSGSNLSDLCLGGQLGH